MENSVARRMRLNAVGFTLNLGLALVQTLLPVYLKALGYSGATIGLVFTVNMALMALTSLPAGRLADAVGFRVPILLSGALYCLIGLAVLLLEHPLAVGMMAALMGVAVGLFRPAATALLSRLVQASRMGTAFAVFYTSCMIGAMSGSFMSGLLSDLYGFRPLFLLLAVTASLSLAMAPPSVRSTGGGSMATSEPPQPQRNAPPQRSMPLDGPLRYFLCGMALHSLGLNVLTSYVALYASVALGMDNVRVGTLVSLWNLGLLFQILWGRFADRFGALLTISAHVVLSNVTWLLYPSSSGFHTASLAMLLFGLVGAMDMPARKTIAAQLSPPSSRGTAMGLVDFSTGIVASAGSVIGGLAWDYMGYYSPFLLGVVINLLATPFLFAVYRALSRGTDKAMGAKAPRRTRREQSTRLMQLDVVDPASYDHGVSLTRKGSRFSPILLD